MRLHYYLLLPFTVANSAMAKETQWFVTVYGEHFQYITGAAATPDVRDGIFLKPDFKSKVIYVRSKKHYELEQFRQNNAIVDSMASDASMSAVSVTTDRAVEHNKENN